MTVFIRLTALLFLAALTSSFGQATNQLIACYPFSGNAQDGFGPNSGTAVNTTLTTDRFGNANSAYFFDRNSYIDLPAAPFTNPTYTLSAWVKLASLPADKDAYTIFSFSEPNQTLALANNSASGGYAWNFFSYNTANTGATSVGSNQLIAVDTWTHLTAIRNTNEIALYLNGERAQTVPVTSTTPLSYTCPLRVCIGARPAPTSLFQLFHGAIDEVRVYRGTLSDAEVRALYRATTCQTDFTLYPITAQPYVSLKNGTWSDPSVWSCGCIPAATDAVQVRHVVMVPAAYQANALRVYIDGAAKVTYGIDGRLVLAP